MFNHTVHFMTRFVAPIIAVGLQSTMKTVLDEFGDNHRFKEGALQVMGVHFSGVGDPQQEASQPGVNKIEFGHFDQTFVEVPVMGLEKMHNEAGLQDGKPGFRRIMTDTAVDGQRAQV